jgi:hypothetical protein
LQREQVVSKGWRFWTEYKPQSFRAAVSAQTWSVFLDASDDIHLLTDVSASYIGFGKDSVIPTKEVKVFTNNNPWFQNNLYFD